MSGATKRKDASFDAPRGDEYRIPCPVCRSVFTTCLMPVQCPVCSSELDIRVKKRRDPPSESKND